MFKRMFPNLDIIYEVFGPKSWRYALEHIDRAVHSITPSLNRLNLIYKTQDADMTLFLKHFVGYYLMSERSGKPFDKGVCKSVGALFLGRYGDECTLTKLLCYFANYCDFKESFRDFDPEDIIIQYNKKFKVWWGNQIAKYGNVPQNIQVIDTAPSGKDGLKLTVRRWLENGEDPREHILYKVFHTVTDEIIHEVKREIELGVF